MGTQSFSLNVACADDVIVCLVSPTVPGSYNSASGYLVLRAL